MSKFEGFGPKVREWLKGLESDNSKQYFIAHRDFYEESIRDQMEALLSELSKDFGGEIKMFRQNRDIRFSRDNSPYKTNTYGILHGTAIAAQGRESSCCAARSSPWAECWSSDAGSIDLRGWSSWRRRGARPDP